MLPKSYQEVEWLESSGKQWIDTRYYPSNKTRVRTTACILTRKTWQFIFGSRSSVTEGQFIVGSHSNVVYAIRSDFGDNRVVAEYIPNIGEFFLIDKNRNSCTIGNVTVVNESNEFSGEYRLALFGVLDGGSASVNFEQTLTGRLKDVSIWTDDELTANLIPVYRKYDEKPGMYDTVRGVFLTNQGLGEFVTGPPVYPSMYRETHPYEMARRRKALISATCHTQMITP